MWKNALALSQEPRTCKAPGKGSDPQRTCCLAGQSGYTMISSSRKLAQCCQEALREGPTRGAKWAPAGRPLTLTVTFPAR